MKIDPAALSARDRADAALAGEAALEVAFEPLGVLARLGGDACLRGGEVRRRRPEGLR